MNFTTNKKDKLKEKGINLTVKQEVYDRYDKEAILEGVTTEEYVDKKIEEFFEEEESNLLLEEAQQKVAYNDTEEEGIKYFLEGCLGYQESDYEVNQTMEYFQKILWDDIEEMNEEELNAFIKC
jgi:hypothetical protein